MPLRALLENGLRLLAPTCGEPHFRVFDDPLTSQFPPFAQWRNPSSSPAVTQVLGGGQNVLSALVKGLVLAKKWPSNHGVRKFKGSLLPSLSQYFS